MRPQSAASLEMTVDRIMYIEIPNLTAVQKNSELTECIN